MKKILEYISNYADYPQKGIIFKDLLGILREPNIFRDLIDKMSSSKEIHDSDAILAIEARGFIFGSAIAFHSGKPMIVVRKPNKLPGKLIMKKYDLEYGSNNLTIQKKSIEKYQRFSVVDDVLATGGTAKCVSDLILSAGKRIVGYSMVVEIKSLNGRKNLKGPVNSQLLVWKIFKYYMSPSEPAVNPTAQKNVNSRRSLGRELTINLNWVIWPCAPQVCKFLLS